MAAPLPCNEAQRLAALRSLEVLDTPAEVEFDRIVRLATNLLGVPISLVSLVDEDRQWFKAGRGVDAAQTPRDQAFCAHAILHDEVMVVEDARADRRFADNPLVTGSLGVRFYAGAPLTLGPDVRIGTLCAIDTHPRRVSVEQRAALADLAAIVVDELHLRMRVKQLAAARVDLRTKASALEDANTSLEHFAYMASHDMRGPIKTLINMADIGLATAQGAVRKPLNFIRGAAAELEGLLEGHRRLSRLELGHIQRPTLRALMAAVEQLRGHSDKVRVLTDGPIACDRNLLVQALNNLVENAERYGRGGFIDVAHGCHQDAMVIRVSNAVDEGLEVDQRLFRPFYRLGEGGEGSGLGLAIVDRVMRLHRGHATATCEDGIFTLELRLPRTLPEAA